MFTFWEKDPPEFDEDRMNYLLYAPEVCPTTGRPHWQSFVQWKPNFKKTLSANAKYWKNAGCKIAIGSLKNQLDYIRGPYEKGDKKKPYNPDWKEFGEYSNQGARKDLDDVRDLIMSGKRVDDICTENPLTYHMYARTLSKLEDIAMRKKWRTEMPECIWYYGKTGTGKSHACMHDYTPETHYIWPKDGERQGGLGWMDAYRQQDTFIINEFRGNIQYGTLLELIDKWPFMVSRRNHEPMPFISKRIIITSSLKPCEIYKYLDANDKLDQLMRRIKLVELTDTDHTK